MSEHGWPDFHDDGLHDDGGAHQDEPLHHDPLHHDPLQDDPLQDDSGGYYEDQHHDELLDHDDSPLGEDHDTPGAHDTPESQESTPEHAADPAAEPEHELHTVGADPDALPEPDTAEVVTAFPPVLDVGPLPEPVDGFPWIDTGSLGLIDPAAVPAGVPADAEVTPQDLADYAGTELPPGAEPWAALAGSDDPATSALAKWWSEHS